MTDHNTEMNARAATASELITAASKILQSFFQKRDLRIEMKDGNDPVTEADHAVDQLVREQLGLIFPNDLILTEETSDGNFDRYRDHEAVWILDPLDGTKNFSHGIPNWACGLAFVSRGEPVLGAIAFADGRKELSPRRGMTQRLTSVSSTRELKHALISMDFPKKADARKRGIEIYSKLLMSGVSGARCMGSAVADFWRIADGQLEAYLHTGLSPWDVAAPAAFVLAAGGRITRLDGTPWNVFCPDVLASNRQLHSRLLSLVNVGNEYRVLRDGPKLTELKGTPKRLHFQLPDTGVIPGQLITAENPKIEWTEEAEICRISFAAEIDMADAYDGMAMPIGPHEFEVLYDPQVREGYSVPAPEKNR